MYDDVRPERAVFPLEPVVRSEGNAATEKGERVEGRVEAGKEESGVMAL